MHPSTRDISGHMQDFGLHILGRSIVDAVFAEIANPYSHAMGLVRCAHAAELLLKARIAEEHPLLIFEKNPKPKNYDGSKLDLDLLLSEGRTIMYSELPDILWAATGHRIRNIEQYHSFGRLRNIITHLAVPNADLSRETLHFAFGVIEPLIREFWNVDVMDYAEIYDCDCEEYVVEELKLIEVQYTRLKRNN